MLIMNGKASYGVRAIFFWLVIISCLLHWSNINVVTCDPPEDPVKCLTGTSDCVVTNFLGSFPDRTTCRAARVVYPIDEDDLISVVRDATKNKTKMKVVTRYVHSSNKLVCPDGEAGLLISTKNLNKVINVNTINGTMTVESGMTLQQLVDEASKSNLALPYTPYWSGVTVGGMLGTGAHGSSLWGLGSAVHDYVLALRIISPGEPKDGYVKVRTLGLCDKDLDAAKVSLGVLGVISQVTLKLQPLFKRNITYETRDDDDLGNEVMTFGMKHEFGDIAWFPDQGKAIYRIDDRVNLTTPGDGLYNSIPYRSSPSWQLQLFRKLEETEESSGYDGLRCITAKAINSYLNDNAFGLTNDGNKFTGYPVIGYQNKMQSSGECLGNDKDDIFDTYCPWDPRANGLFFQNNGFTLPMSKARNFIQDIRRLVKLKPTSLCGVDMYSGILMRYVKASSAYLGKEEDGIDFDITYYKSKEAFGPRIFEDILDEIEQIAIFKYGGLPHWGKNRNVAFVDVINKFKHGEEFLRVKEKYDPLSLFSSEWTDQVLGFKGLSPIIKQEGCAREGLCICSKAKDIDYCGSGYSCDDGLVYSKAKVCREREGKLITDI